MFTAVCFYIQVQHYNPTTHKQAESAGAPLELIRNTTLLLKGHQPHADFSYCSWKHVVGSILTITVGSKGLALRRRTWKRKQAS